MVKFLAKSLTYLMRLRRPSNAFPFRRKLQLCKRLSIWTPQFEQPLKVNCQAPVDVKNHTIRGASEKNKNIEASDVRSFKINDFFVRYFIEDNFYSKVVNQDLGIKLWGCSRYGCNKFITFYLPVSSYSLFRVTVFLSLLVLLDGISSLSKI